MSTPGATLRYWASASTSRLVSASAAQASNSLAHVGWVVLLEVDGAQVVNEKNHFR